MKTMSIWALALVLLMPVRFSAESTIAGDWQWMGTSGWQKVTLHLEGQGTRITGKIRMGPGAEGIRTPDDYWRYFFETAVFPISNVKIEGNKISFEQLTPDLAYSSSLPKVPDSSLDKFFYNGIIDGDRIRFTRQWTARPKAPFELGTHKVEFTMIRAGASDSGSVSENQQKPRSLERVVRTGPVSLDVEVMDSGGRAVTNLAQDDFQLYENGELRAIQSFDAANASRSFLLLYDHNLTWLENSSQTYPSNYVVDGWNLLLRASTQFLGHLPARDQVSIATFEDKIPAAVRWWSGNSKLPPVSMDVAKIPGGEKDLYGVIEWALGQFGTQRGAGTVIVFTDGRDGRLSPRWFRDSENREVLDPLFGLTDVAEEQELEKLLDSVAKGGVRLYFIAVNTDQDPEFGPAVVRRRISGLFPGAREGIDNYLRLVRSRMEAVAEASGGRVLYGDASADALRLYLSLDKTLGIGTSYTLRYLAAQSAAGTDHRITVRIRDREDLQVSQFRTGDISR
jgi:hypothetical protein